MKTIVCVLLATLVLGNIAAAEELAVMKIRYPDSKELQRVVIKFDEQSAPLTVENFKRLAKKRFYKGIKFHRTFPGIMVQTGDPLSRGKDRSRVGTGGPGYTIPAEIKAKHKKGSVVMGRLPDETNPTRRSSGSQFYIALKPLPELDGKYTVFGEVIEGIELLEGMSQTPVDTNDNPRKPFVIRSLDIIPIEKFAPPEPPAETPPQS